MEQFKIGTKVAYIGGEVIFGYKNKLELDRRQLQPLPETYIWHVIKRVGEPTIYIIQHNQGVGVEFFKEQTKAFGKNDFSKLAEDLKYTYVSESELTFLECEDITLEEEKITQNNNSTEKELAQKKEIESYIEKEEIEDQNTTNEHKEDIPHFTPQNFVIPNESTQTIVAKNVLRCKKIGSTFSVQLSCGETIFGTETDYLLINTSKQLDIISEKEYALNYEKVDIPTKVGKDQTEHYLTAEARDYIIFLEQENVRLRAELHLK